MVCHLNCRLQSTVGCIVAVLNDMYVSIFSKFLDNFVSVIWMKLNHKILITNTELAFRIIKVRTRFVMEYTTEIHINNE